ncbi:MAG: MG2 domain-containing protein [Bdellovibrionota bacterium]
MTKLIRLSLFTSLLSLFIFGGCEPPKQKSGEAGSSGATATAAPTNAATSPGKADIRVDLAPFDRFPTSDRFPLVFRFNQPVAPASRYDVENFAQLQISPSKYGSWRWVSDSELNFEPKDAWVPRETVDISLKGLKTSDGTQSEGPKFSPETFHVSLPAATVALASCDFAIRNRAPLIQYPEVKLRFNYVPDSDHVSPFLSLKLKKGTAEESLKAGFSSSGNAMTVTGPDIFRPTEPISVEFQLKDGVRFQRGGTLEKGIDCSFQSDTDAWDKLAEASKAPVAPPPVVVVSANDPTHAIWGTDENRNPLIVHFTRAWSTDNISHGKPKGITLEQGLALSPAIPGVWKTDTSDENSINFVPTAPWPVGERVTISVDQATFPNVSFKDSSATFTTPPMLAEFGSQTLYTNPENPSLRQATVTLRMSHPPKPGDVERLISAQMRIEPQKSFTASGVKSLKLTTTPDAKDPRTVYVKSENIDLPNEPGEVRFSLASGLSAAQGGVPTKYNSSVLLSIPSKKEIFRIESASASVVKKNPETIQRILSLEVTEPVAAESLLSALEVSVLPDCKQKENKKVCRDHEILADEALVNEDVLKKSQPIAVSPVPRDEATLPNMFLFSFEAPGNREIFIRVKKGLQSQTKFALAADFRSVQHTKPFPKDLKVMHEGALLSVSGSKKLGISLRGVEKVEYELARIMPHDVHHLVSVTSGSFKNPSFDSSHITLDQLAERFRYVETFPEQDPGKTYYSAVDFGRFVAKGPSPKGLFVLTIREKKDEKKGAVDSDEDSSEDEAVDESDEGEGEDEAAEGEGEGEACEDDSCGGENEYTSSSRSGPRSDSRLVLLTDLGLLVKDTLSGEHNVFVMSFRTGEPVAGASVKLLGQNGAPIFTATSGADGQVRFPATKDLKQEKVPLVYVVEKNDDYSFLPFDRNDRQLNFSRFETGGVFNADEAEGLRALAFSDRGIYRPGEEARFGIIIRRRNLEAAATNLPLEISVRDPRGVEIVRRKFALTSSGFEDFRWSTENALTGTYTLGIYLVRGPEEEKQSLLGSTNFRVDEFQPDKLAVTSHYLENTPQPGASGWFSPSGKFEVKVANLFGTAAVDNTVKGTLLVRPWNGTFDGFPEYNFYSRDIASDLPTQPEDLGELNTDVNGVVQFVPDLTRFAERAFRLEFAAEAFEKESGRSVVSTAQTLVSSAPHFLGWKADGGLDFVAKGAGRKLSLVAVGPDTKAKGLAGVKMKLDQTTMISALVKLPNGSLQYQLTPKVSQVWEGELNVEDKGTDFMLKTDEPGDFKLRFFDTTGEQLAVVSYQVHGEGNTTFMADRAAEVGIRLNKYSVEPNEELEVSINTPYIGSGLITIERDKVYAAQWFRTDTLSSVQKIKVPAGIVGNAYISVAFVRSLESKDIFASPLSYGVKPFSIARSEYTTAVDLDVPAKAKPGQDLVVKYKTNNAGQVLLYAVDEGILQFAHYKTPDPVSSFVPKRALEVDTYQILDLLLPDHKIVEELSSTGGDEDVGLGKFKNPFARKKRAPMAFWSGILPQATEGTVKIPIPEYFNGTVRVFAVQVGQKKLGITTKQTVAQHDFVIDPQAPYFVSPGDEFEVGATVANTVQGSGKDVKVSLTVAPSAGFELAEKKPMELVIPEGEDRSFRVRLKAKDVLGEQEFKIEASGLNRKETATETISLRPPQALRTTLQGGMYRPNKDGTNAEKSLTTFRTMYAEKRDVTAAISSSPLTVGRGLITYLKGYPYGCTEQLVSAAFPAVLFGTDPELGLSQQDVDRFTKRAFQTLSSRQRADGSFGLWDVLSEPDELFTVYAIHFLLEAKEHSLEIPTTVYSRAKEWMTAYSTKTLYDARQHLTQAYALYLRARDGERVTKEAQSLVSELDRQWGNDWRETTIAMFLAATFKQLQMDTEANALLKKPAGVWNGTRLGWPMNDPAMHASIYAFLTAKHFPKETWLSPLDTLLGVSAIIDNKSFTTFNSSFALLGLAATGEALSQNQREFLKILAKANADAAELPLAGERILNAQVPIDTKQLVYRGKSGEMFFYGASETGYDRVQAPAYSSGLTIDRELRNEKGEKKDVFDLNEKLEVTLFIKGSESLTRMAILELIPGGFEIDLGDEGLASRKSLHEDGNTWHPQFIDIQEDRLIFFGDLPQDTVTFTYRLKPLSRGKYTFAAPYAEGMYDPAKGFLGTLGAVEVK